MLLVPLLTLVLLALVARRSAELPIGRRSAPPHPDSAPSAASFRARRAFGAGEVALRLAPLHADARTQAFDAVALAERLGLAEGEPWRLTLVRGGGPRASEVASAPASVAIDLARLRVIDDAGLALAPIPAAPPAEAVADPLRALFALPETCPWTGERAELVLFGRAPGEGARVSGLPAEAGLAGEVLLERGAIELAPEGGPVASDAPGAADRAASERELAARVRELEARLAREIGLRAQRETEWLEYTRAIRSLDAALDAPRVPRAPGFLGADGEARAAAEPAPEAEPDPERERAQAMLPELRAALAAEQVYGFDVLELGRVTEGGVGPVVVRLVDDWGRPVGTLGAERLRLEKSRAARTLTLVFEHGYQTRGGVAVPFEGEDVDGLPSPPPADGKPRGGVRRVHLDGVDPSPWLRSFPELFDPAAADEPLDDGRWDRVEVQARLNGLLEAEAASVRWRVRGLGGVDGNRLRDVHVVQLDDRGRVLARYFADRLTIEMPAAGGVRLLLEDGVVERAGRRAPFLDGRFRIVLPSADARAWAGVELPGLEGADTASAGSG